MRTVPPGQACFSAALTAAAVVIISPSLHWPSAAPAATLDALTARPSRTAEQPVLHEGRGIPSYRATAVAVTAPPSAPRISDDVESASLIPSPAPSPARHAAPAASTKGTAAAYPSYTPLPSQSGAYASVQGDAGSASSFQACVIARESGGNSQVMNSSGHYGLYQFSYSTWVEYGGSGADFGHASVAEQNQVFANAMATPGGEDNWSPYDGCTL
jgi:hypothetical protein